MAENTADSRAGIPCRLLTPQVSEIRSLDNKAGCKVNILIVYCLANITNVIWRFLQHHKHIVTPVGNLP